MISVPHLVKASLQVESHAPNFSYAYNLSHITDGDYDPNFCYASEYNEPKEFDPFVNLTLGQPVTVQQVDVLLRDNSNDMES